MFAILNPPGGRVRPIHSASVAVVAVCLSTGLIYPSSVHASNQTTPRGAPGAATSALATPLETGFSYQGAVSKRNKRLWYRLNGAGAKRIVLHVRGKSPTCAVRASLLDARGRPLAQLITAPGETLPFVVLIPVKAVSNTYYLRLDVDPFSSCVNAGYVFTLAEPEQAASKAPLASPPIARVARVLDACEAVGSTLSRLTVRVAKERGLVFHKRAGIKTLRRLEAKRRALARRVYHLCTEL